MVLGTQGYTQAIGPVLEDPLTPVWAPANPAVWAGRDGVLRPSPSKELIRLNLIIKFLPILPPPLHLSPWLKSYLFLG